MDLLSNLTPADGIAALAALAVKGSLLFLLAFLVVGFLRRASAATRHAVWAFALGAALVLPLFLFALPGWQVPVLPGPTGALAAVSAPPAPPEALLPPAPPSAPAAPTPAPAPPVVIEHRAEQDITVMTHRQGPRAIVVERHRAVAPPVVVSPAPVQAGPLAGIGSNWRMWLLWAWVAGVAVIALRWVLAVLGAWRLVQTAEPVYDLDWLELKERVAFGMDLDRPVRLLRSDRVSVPIAGGVFDPVVVLPPDADSWDENRREVVLTHELAHIVRRDCLTQTLAQGALALHWFNPLAWMSYRRFMLEREHACDDWVLKNGARASDYAQHLVQIARRFRRESLSLAATAPMARRSNLEGRILSILDPEQSREGTSRFGLATVGVMTLALVAPLAAFQPVEGEPDLTPLASVYDMPKQPTVTVTASKIHRQDDTFTWEGRVGSGGFVEIHGVNGAIRARTGSGDRVRVEAEKEPRRGQEDDVEIVVEEFRNGVVVCAVYPGQRRECEPGRGAQGDIRENDVQVAFDVVLPEDVRFLGYTVNGSIKTEPLGADVEAHTVNGSIETASRRGDVTAKTVNGSITAEAGGLVLAQTVNGSINARLGEATPERGMGFETTNGSITVELPDSFNAEVRAQASTGSIKSDFPLRIERNGHVGSEATGRLGSGGPELQLEVLNGSIKLRRHSSSFGADFDFDHDVDVGYDIDHDQIRREIEQAMAEIGPVMELAMAEAGRAMAEIDFEQEVALAMEDVDWEEIRVEMEAALAEAEIDRKEIRAEIADGLEDALDDVRDDLDDVRDDLIELEREASPSSEREAAEFRRARSELRAAKAALLEVERGLERALCETREQHDGDCSDKP